MSASPSAVTAFAAGRCIASGSRGAVAVAVKRAAEAGEAALLVFEDASGLPVDFDLRGADDEIRARADAAAPGGAEPAPGGAPRGRGRPKLGVVGREVTLLPRHWEWLGRQPGGASVALRKLIDEKRATGGGAAAATAAQAVADRVMGALAGDLPRYEEASRALYRRDGDRFANCVADWPADVRNYVMRLAAPAFAPDDAAINAQTSNGATLT